MAETIEHRITNLVDKGLFIMTVDGIEDLRNKNPLPKTSSSADCTPSISKDELLGFFTNRDAEYVIDKCWGSGNDLTNSYSHNSNALVSAFNYGKRLGLFDDLTKYVIFEVHAIVDEVQNRTHYFLMPHRNYLKYELIGISSKVKWSFQIKFVVSHNYVTL